MKKMDLDLASLRETRGREYVERFLFGGLCTAIAGIIAKRFGPQIGGLFLAFPAIFPASVTMIESHEKRRKAEVGSDGTLRGRFAASIDASGAALGCLGLALFGFIVWRLLPQHNALSVIAAATVAWAATSYLFWAVRKS